MLNEHRKSPHTSLAFHATHIEWIIKNCESCPVNYKKTIETTRSKENVDQNDGRSSEGGSN